MFRARQESDRDCHDGCQQLTGASSADNEETKVREQEHDGSCHDGCQQLTGTLPAGNEKIKEREQEEGMTIIEMSLPMTESAQKLIFKVEGMCCATEVEHLKIVLNPLVDKIEANVTFDLINAKLILESKSDNLPSKDEIIRAVASTGMKAILWNEHIKQGHEKKSFWQKYGHVSMNIASAASLVVGFAFQAARDGVSAAFGGGIEEGQQTERSNDPPIVTMVFYSTSIVAGAWFILPKAVRSVRRLHPDINLLMVIATAGAVGINQWFEAATAMYLFSASELLESWNMARTRNAIHALMELAPSTAQVLNEDGMFTEQLVDQIPIGTTIIVRPGEKIPMDSILLLGATSVNQAPITGESLPVQKEEGDPLFAGTINGDSVIQCRVTKEASNSTLASIIRKVEEAQSKRAKSDQFIERFSYYYVPSAIVASTMVCVVPPLVTGGSWYPWAYKGLELLVISCPCSLVISTPVSIVAGLAAAARSGILIKGGVYLEKAAYIKAFAMDKTGTLTTGEPVVQDVIPLNGYDTEALLKLASALEIHSDHPLARAIQRKARADGILYQPAEQFQVFKGKGAEGYIDGELFWIGSHRFLHENVGENEPTEVHEKIQALEAAGHSIVAIGHGQEICGLISVADTLRPESIKAIQALKRAGIERVVMLTGDNDGAASTIAKLVGVDEYHAELLPEDKVKQVKLLVARYRQVAMVGDGINDAPAMATASLGIAMGAAGSDAAIETADIALMSDDLEKLAWLVNHSNRTLNIIKQNVIFSLAVKVAFVGLTFANKSTLWMAMLSDMGASFIVVSNGLRLLNDRSAGCFGRREVASSQVQRGSSVERMPPPVLHQFAKTQASLSSLQPTVNKGCKSGNCSSDACHRDASPVLHQFAKTQASLSSLQPTTSKGCKNGNCSSDARHEDSSPVLHQFAKTQASLSSLQPTASKVCKSGNCNSDACHGDSSLLQQGEEAQDVVSVIAPQEIERREQALANQQQETDVSLRLALI